MVPDVLGCLPVPARTPALPMVSQLVDLVCAEEVALSVLPSVCLSIFSKKKAPVMEAGATSASTYCLRGERAKGHPPAGSGDVCARCQSEVA